MYVDSYDNLHICSNPDNQLVAAVAGSSNSSSSNNRRKNLEYNYTKQNTNTFNNVLFTYSENIIFCELFQMFDGKPYPTTNYQIPISSGELQ